MLEQAVARSRTATTGVAETHAGLAMADALNFQAALVLGAEAHAQLFLHVYRGR